MTRSPLLSFVAICLALASGVGCASSSRKLNRLTPGMTKEEVLLSLGKPHATSAQGPVEFLTYNLINRGAGDLREYTVKLVNGTVDSYGERTDFGPARLAGTNAPARN